ncbi:hypothetical protein KSP40_PGU000777 [Platanthera guangdongensis]|uniref:Uncharacterized protein n=1 Tax=Platanthera guangdongensis TaxID=2320717 RepID=A0ABR2LUN9_9ASPA
MWCGWGFVPSHHIEPGEQVYRVAGSGGEGGDPPGLRGGGGVEDVDVEVGGGFDDEWGLLRRGRLGFHQQVYQAVEDQALLRQGSLLHRTPKQLQIEIAFQSALLHRTPKHSAAFQNCSPEIYFKTTLSR